MNTTLRIALASALMMLNVTAASADADKGGNGGGAHYCPNPTATQMKYEAYDLWLGKNPIDPKKKLTIPPYDGVSSKEDYLEAAIQKVRMKSPSLADAIERALLILNSHLNDSGNMELAKVADAHELRHERGCGYLQLVNWIDSPADLKKHRLEKQVVLRDQVSYEAMDPLNQAANDFHEAAYKVARAFDLIGESGSLPVQRLTAEAFAVEEIAQESIDAVSLYDKILGLRSGLKYSSYPVTVHMAPDEAPKAIAVFLGGACGRGEFNQGQIRFKNISATTVKIWPYSSKNIKLEPGQSATLPVAHKYAQKHIGTRDAVQTLGVRVPNLFFNKKYTTHPEFEVEVEVCGQTFQRKLKMTDGISLSIYILRSPI